MRLFTKMVERLNLDAQERRHMIRHRLDSIEYKTKLLQEGIAAYAFHSVDLATSFTMFDVGELELADLKIKRDPLFGHCHNTIVPCVSTEALVREAQDYLGEEIFSSDSLEGLNFPKKPIREDKEYWLAWKIVPPFSPLLTLEEQNDVHRRTVLAQEGHFDDMEFADDNPVGMPVGILISEASLESTQKHIEDCDVFPDTVVEYTRLLTLAQSWELSMKELEELRTPMERTSPFGDGSRNSSL